MAKQRKGDRHTTKPFQVRLHNQLRKQLGILAKRNLSTLTAEVTRAIRELLQREELWPPKPGKDESE